MQALTKKGLRRIKKGCNMKKLILGIIVILISGCGTIQSVNYLNGLQIYMTRNQAAKIMEGRGTLCESRVENGNLIEVVEYRLWDPNNVEYWSIFRLTFRDNSLLKWEKVISNVQEHDIKIHQ